MATLTGKQLKDSYQGLLTIKTADDANPLSGRLENGLGNAITNLGIGTDSPGYKLEINGSGTVARFTDGTSHMDFYSGSGLNEIATVSPLLLSVGGTERMRIGSGGDISFRDTSTNEAFYWDASTARLGLGTTSPDNALTVNGGSKVFSSATNNSITTSVNTTSAYAQTITLDDVGLSFDNNSNLRGYRFSNNGSERLRIDSSGNVQLASSEQAIQWASGNGIIQAPTNLYIRTSSAGGNLLFQVNNDEKMRIDSSGNVGIGITNPSDYFTNFNDLVVGSTSADSGITIVSSTTDDGTLAFADGTTGDQAYRGYIQYSHGTDNLSVGTAGGEAIRIDSSGNVGFGVSPSAKLHVNDTTYPTLRLSTATSYSNIYHDGTTGSIAYSADDGGAIASSSHQFYIDGGEKMRIDTSGNLDMSVGGGNIILDSGAGIDFSDTADGSGSTTSELLDDYEEGTFTATISGGTFTGLNTGKYTKIGRLVYWYLSPVTTAITGNLTISSLPFTCADRSASIFATSPPSGVTYIPVFHNSSSASVEINVSGTYSGAGLSTYFSGVYSV